MRGWEIFWLLCLIIAGGAFALITLVVAVKGFKDLRQMLGDLSRNHDTQNND